MKLALYRMSEMNEFRLCVPADLTRRFKGLSIDAGMLFMYLLTVVVIIVRDGDSVFCE